THDAGVTGFQLFQALQLRDVHRLLVPLQVEMRHVVRYLRDKASGVHAGNSRDDCVNRVQPAFPVSPLGLMVDLQVALEGYVHADYFLFAPLQRAPDGIFAGVIVEQSRVDKVLAAEQQTGALRSAQPLTAAETHEIEPHFVVVAEVRDRWNVSRGVIERWDVVALASFDPFLQSDLTLVLRLVEEVQHGGPRADGALQIFLRFHFYQAHTDVAD